MRRFQLIVPVGIGLTAIAASAQVLSVPPTVHECEANKCDGIWTFGGSEGSAQWQMGARASLKVERFDSAAVIIRRTDVNGSSSPGLTAVYTGRLQGNR